MSDTEDRVLWHLTNSGWVRGPSVVAVGSRYDDQSVPAGRLETWTVDYEVCSQYGVPVGTYAVRIWPAADAAPPPSAAAWEAAPPPWRSFATRSVEWPRPE